MKRRRGRRLAILLSGLALCSLFAGVGVVGTTGGTHFAETQSASEPNVEDVETESFEADRTIFIITVRENGSAEWRFRYEQRLETDGEIQDFRAYADRFNAEETDSFANFRERAIALTESGSEATGREMKAERFNRSARIEERPPAGEEFAVIEMSFEWSGFAAAEGEEVVVGDVFTGGLYVGPEQQLRFERGANLQFDSTETEPEPDSTSAETLAESETITWMGERSFADRQPRVTLIERESGAATPPETEPDNTSTEPESDDTPAESDGESEDPERTAADGLNPAVVLGAVGIAIVLGAGAAVAYRTGLLPTTVFGVDRSKSNGGVVGKIEETEPTARDASSGTRGKRPGTADDESPTDGTTPAIADEQFLSDEERVVALLETRGGRMKQVDIVDRTDWSKSKVSMLLSEMESEGSISKLRVGRENIVSLAGHEPEAVGSPFDDE